MTHGYTDEQVDGAGREVDADEYRRLMGLPRRGPVNVAILDGMRAAVRWFDEHARPWTRARRRQVRDTTSDGVLLHDATGLRAPALARRFGAARVETIFCAAVSAGPEAGQTRPAALSA